MGLRGVGGGGRGGRKIGDCMVIKGTDRGSAVAIKGGDCCKLTANKGGSLEYYRVLGIDQVKPPPPPGD